MLNIWQGTITPLFLFHGRIRRWGWLLGSFTVAFLLMSITVRGRDAHAFPITPMSDTQVTPPYLSQIWKTSFLGSGGGRMRIIDVDNDGQLEIITTGYLYPSPYWLIFGYSSLTGEYEVEWVSSDYQSVTEIQVADVDNNGFYEIYIAHYDGTVDIYDGPTKQHLANLDSIVYDMQEMVIADTDNDGAQEIVLGGDGILAVYDAATLSPEWQINSIGVYALEVANVDADPAPELVTSDRVIDGITHVVEWFNYGDAGVNYVALADIDNDGMAEIIMANGSPETIRALDADTQTTKWTYTIEIDISALEALDFDNDGVIEIVYGDRQPYHVHVFNSITLVEEWQITNPQSGVTDIAFGDVDADGILEMVWGVGSTSGGPDYLVVADTTTHTIEWQSLDVRGGFSAVDVGDVDNDGRDEIVMASPYTDNYYKSGVISIYDAQTFQLEWRSTPIITTTTNQGIRSLILANIDQDDALEILIGTDHPVTVNSGGVVIAYDGITHEMEWETEPIPFISFASLAVADIDNDNQLEVIAGEDSITSGRYNLYVHVFNASDGTLEWSTDPIPTNDSSSVYDLATGDFDNDGHIEILFSVVYGPAYVVDGVTHAIEWQSSQTVLRAVAAVDVDQDGQIELLIADDTGKLYAFDGTTHALEWSETLANKAITSIRLADFDKDSVAELVLTDDDYLFVRDATTRTLLWQSEDLGHRVALNGHIFIGDMNGDARDEVVLGSNYALYAFTYSQLPYLPAQTVNAPFVQPGETLVYTLSVANLTTSTVSLVVTDTIPAQTTVVNGSIVASHGNWGYANGTITWTADLTTSQVVSLTFAVTVAAAAPDGLVIQNTAIYAAAGYSEIRTTQAQVDALPPDSLIVSPIANQLISSTIYTILGTATDTVSGIDSVEIRINGGAWTPTSGHTNWVFTWAVPITDDQFTLETRAIDNVGNVETTLAMVTVRVDRLLPQLLSSSPVHQSEDVPLDSDLVLLFSEPVVLSTFQLTCQPGIGQWSALLSGDGQTITVTHDGFMAGQTYSCEVAVDDEANHGLQPGGVPNPWLFTAVSYPAVYLPLVIK